MKPNSLKFFGLQSYREEQNIDFAELGSLGIFGVFGPTGSGKSTILDAITLALFGKVERAKSGTRGILNQFEDKLSVSFEFSLGEDSYLAERLYAREKNDPDSVRNRHSRLIKLSAGNQVLADKASDMDNKVVQLLGMSFDDFSRAVILPQGKFDQFLKLTGGDRARMLENILRLERYGENLWKKASRLENSLSQEIQTDQKLLEQLGDASAGAFEQAEKKLDIQGSLVITKEKEKKAAETALKEMEQLEELHKEFTSLQQQQSKLEEEKAQLANDRIRLETALKAEPLRGLLNQVAGLTAGEKGEDSKVKLQQTVCAKTAEKLKQAEEGVTRAKLAEDQLQNLREQVLPQVVLALDYEKQLKGLEGELRGIQEGLRNKQVESEKLVIEGKEKGRRNDQAISERDKLIVRKQELAQALAYKPRVEKAVTFLVDLETAEQQATEAEQALAGRQKALQVEEQKLKTILAEFVDSKNIEIHRENYLEIAGTVQEFVEHAKDRFARSQESHDKLIMKNMAESLAGKLAPGEPCPVCGSTTHPHLIAGHAENTASLEAAKNDLDGARKNHDKVMAWERKAGLVLNTLKTISDEISSVHQINMEKKKATLSEALEKWQQQAAQLAECSNVIQALSGVSATDRGSLRESKAALDNADQEYKQIEKKVEDWEKELRKLEPELSQLRETFLGLKYDLANLQKNAKAAEDSAARLKTTLVDITGGLSAEEFQQKINNQLSILQKEITDAGIALDKARSENQEAEKTLGALKAGLETTRTHLNNVRESLQTGMVKQCFSGTDELGAALLSEEQRQSIQKCLDDNAKARDFVAQTLQEVSARIKDKPFDQEQISLVRQNLAEVQKEYEEAVREQGALSKSLNDLKIRQAEWQRLQVEINRLTERRELAAKLVSLLKGRKLVQFLAEEHLRDMAAEASVRLAGLTGQRYALELDEGCNFVMRDDYNAGQRRPVNTLSGGETFLTSLSLALALSSKIQLKGQYPLGFFFLDEGFGTLDPEKLEVVVNTLEKLHDGQRVVGIITHVPELRSRMPRYLEVSAARIDGTGSKVVMKKS